MIYADTSFIASAYGKDVNTAAARSYLLREEPTLPFGFLHWPELTRFLWITQPEVADKIWDLVSEDLMERKKLAAHEADANRVSRRAAGLLRHYCPRWQKLRCLDTLHVAYAVEENFKTFLSFDIASYQRVLASSQKLKVWPPLTESEMKLLKQLPCPPTPLTKTPRRPSAQSRRPIKSTPKP